MLYNMEQLSNTEENTATRSSLADWVGSVTLIPSSPHETIRQNEDKMTPDFNDISTRMIDMIGDFNNNGVNYILVGPASSSSWLFNPVGTLGFTSISSLLGLYEGFAWDSIDVTLSLSDAKGLAGAIAFGYYPFVPWYGNGSKTDETNRNFGTFMQVQRTFLSPECQLVPFSQATDAKFTIPWQFSTPYITFEDIEDTAVWIENGIGYLDYGSPIVYVSKINSTYVSSISKPAQMRLFCKYNNFRCTGPTPTNIELMSKRRNNIRRMEVQSGAAVAAAALVADMVISTGVEILQETVFGNDSDDLPEYQKDGTYERPMAIQPAFLGDATGVGPPSTSPIFYKDMPDQGFKHKIIDYLKRPQLVRLQSVNGATKTYYANPTFCEGWVDGPVQDVTYFKWFSAAAQFWRGTLCYDFVILGHPMVEVGYDFQIGFPEFSLTNLMPGTATFSPTLSGIANGVAHFRVPMPSMLVVDHIPIIDTLVSPDGELTDQVAACSTSFVNASFRVISTMLDVDPTLTVLVFISCEDDFVFLQPAAVGLANPGDVPVSGVKNVKPSPPDRKRNIGTLEVQMGLPPVTQVFETRATIQNNSNTLPTLVEVEDCFKMWARAVPYATNNVSGEPIPRYEVGACPSWWNCESPDSAAWTPNVNNSWYMTNDYLSLFSSQFLYYRGSIGHKVVCSDTNDALYKYVSLGLLFPKFRQPCHTPFTYSTSAIPLDANLGYGVAITPLDKQPVLDLTIPFRSSLVWRPIFWKYTSTTNPSSSWGLTSAPSLTHNIVLINEDGDLADALFRKAGADYHVAVEGLLPPPYLWVARGFDWST